VRTTLPDRPGALALLAATCGEAGVNILGLQIFPGIEAVTDELVLSTPEDWTEADLADLVGRSGGHSVSAGPCTEAALTDQPTRYVQAARTILAQPASFPEVVARLFDAEADPAADGAALDVMEMTVGEVQVQVRRSAPFTATEHARGASMAALVSDVLERVRETTVGRTAGRRVGGGATPEYVVDGETVAALVDGVAVGLATVRPAAAEDDVRLVTLRVDPAWQRRGIGTRLLVDAARLATALGATGILLTTRADNQAVLPMVMASGLRGRIRLAGDTLTVRVAVGDLKPLRQ
jgi:ribosomal protein S18 acetylase RimI-like enzyme